VPLPDVFGPIRPYLHSEALSGVWVQLVELARVKSSIGHPNCLSEYETHGLRSFMAGSQLFGSATISLGEQTHEFLGVQVK
jgi:hypothetical protein